jgi:hypothetical protein
MHWTRLCSFALCAALSACGDNGPPGPTIDGAPGVPDGAAGAIDGATTVDGSGPGGDADVSVVSIHCGDMTCGAGQVCCWREVGPTLSGQCQAPGDACAPNGQIFACDSPEDCDGNACCGDAAGGSTCSAGDTCPVIELCVEIDDCEAGEMCCDPPGPVSPWTYARCMPGGCPD